MCIRDRHFAVYVGKLALGVVRGDVCACHTAKHGDEHDTGHALVRGEGSCGRAIEQRLIGHIFDGILCPVARDVGEGAYRTPVSYTHLRSAAHLNLRP